MAGLTKGKITLDLKITNKSVWEQLDNALFTALGSGIWSYREHLQACGFPLFPELMHLGRVRDTGYLVMQYKAGEGFYDWHHDHCVTDLGTFRAFAFIWYLNDVNKGGETEFFGNKVTPKQGRLLIFPSTWTCMHRALVPESNDKYVVTGWLMSSIRL